MTILAYCVVWTCCVVNYVRGKVGLPNGGDTAPNSCFHYFCAIEWRVMKIMLFGETILIREHEL